MLTFIICSIIAVLLFRTSLFKFVLYIGVGVLFNPVTLLIIILVIEATKRGGK